MDTSPIRVLHVDDDTSLLELTGEFLEHEDDRLVLETATSADEGLNQIEDRPPDCIVSDYDMPGKNGIEFLQTLRKTHPDLPFILFTGKGSEAVASDAISNGATDYLQKGGGSDRYKLLANRVKNAVEQYRSNRRATDLERIRQLVSDVNQALVRATSTEEVETRVCQLISDSEPYITACIADVDRNTMEIEPRTWAGEAAGYFDELQMAVDEGSPGRHAPGGRAFHDREIAVSQNIQADNRYATWQEAALERGFRSLAVVPIEYEDELYGLLTAFASRPNAFDQTEGDLLAELADDTAHALHRQSLQADLEQTNAELRCIMRQVPVGIILMDYTDGTFRYRQFNRRMEELSGLSSEDIRNKTPQEALGPEDGAEVVDRYRDCVEHEEAIEYTSTFKIDGEAAVRKGAVSPVTADGEVEQLVVVVQDITEERRRQEQLERTTARLRALFNNSPDMITVHDGNGNIVDPNARLCEATGYDAGTVSGMKVWELDQAITLEEAKALWEGMEAGDRHRLEGVYQRQDGSTFPVEVHLRCLSLDGESRFVAIARDITDRKQREQDLRTEQQLIESLFNALPDPVYAFDTDGSPIRWNECLEAVTGYTSAEIQELHVTDFVPEEDTDLIATNFQKIIEERQSVTVESAFQTKDSDRVPHEFTGGPLEDADGALRGATGVGRNLTERKNAERKLKRQNEQLEEFASVVSHDLRNPLRTAEGRLELAQADCDSAHLDDVAGALDRMDALIEDLLTLARGGETVGSAEAVSLSSLIEECWEVVPDENATLIIETDRTISADRSRLRQLLENLLANAVEHGCAGVTVRVDDLTDGFYIADDGVGIPEGEREDIFESGYSTAEEGTGFGLRITKQIVDAHGWDIRVTDSDDDGAQFEITGVDTPD